MQKINPESFLFLYTLTLYFTFKLLYSTLAEESPLKPLQNIDRNSKLWQTHPYRLLTIFKVLEKDKIACKPGVETPVILTCSLE